MATVCLSACGGSSPPHAAAPIAETTPAPSSTTESGSKPESKAGQVEREREAFVSRCTERAQSPEYCACGFEQYKAMEMEGAVEHDKAAWLGQLRDRVKSACAKKLSEDGVKGNFTKACIGEEPKKTGYCTCAWQSLRTRLQVVDFIGDEASMNTPSWMAARQAMVKDCKGKFPADVAKGEFMNGCTKDDPANKKECDCLWKKVAHAFTVEEIAAGTVDVATAPGLASCK